MSKTTNKFGIGKFLVMALVLGGGLVYGTQMVQKNQENRSSAAAPVVICKCSNPKYGNAYNCAKNKGKWSCTSAKSTPTPVKNNNQKYYFYNGSKCVQTGDSYTSVSACGVSVRSVCYSSLSGCENANSSKLINCGYYKDTSSCNNNGCEWISNYSKCSPKGSVNCVISGKYVLSGDSECINNLVGSKMIKCDNGKGLTVKTYQNKNCDTGKCSWAGTDISDGESKCFNIIEGISSQKVTCTNGKAKVVTTYPNRDCITAETGSCTYGATGLVILDGQSRCYNHIENNKSTLIKCTNGKASIVATYLTDDCTINTTKDCLYFGTTIASGKSQCFNDLLGGSNLVSCTNGEALVGAYYPKKDCSTN